MKNKKSLFVALMMVMLPLSNVHVSATPEIIPLQVEIIDPTNGQENPQRSPTLVPEVSIDDYTLTFVTPCDGFTLQLLDENGNVAYSIVIPTNASSVILPAYLEGEYEIQIIGNSNYYFYGYITL